MSSDSDDLASNIHSLQTGESSNSLVFLEKKDHFAANMLSTVSDQVSKSEKTEDSRNPRCPVHFDYVELDAFVAGWEESLSIGNQEELEESVESTEFGSNYEPTRRLNLVTCVPPPKPFCRAPLRLTTPKVVDKKTQAKQDFLCSSMYLYFTLGALLLS